MSINFPGTTLCIGRDMVRNHVAAILHMVSTDDPAAWDHARSLCGELVDITKTGSVELAHYHGQMASTLLTTPREDVAFDEAEARAIDAAKAEQTSRCKPDPFFHPVFADAIAAVQMRPPQRLA